MNDTYIDGLESSFINLCKNPSMDNYKRAFLLGGMIERSGLTQRQFGKKYGIPKSTLTNWLLYGKITPDKMEECKKMGFTQTQILRGLQDRQKHELREPYALDIQIDVLTNELNSSTITNKISNKTYDKLEHLKKAIETARFRIETRTPKLIVRN